MTKLGNGYCSNCKEHESSPKFCQYCEIHTLRWQVRQRDIDLKSVYEKGFKQGVRQAAHHIPVEDSDE